MSLHVGGPGGGFGDGGRPEGGFGDGGRPDGGGFHTSDGGSFFEQDGGTACANCHGATAAGADAGGGNPFADVSGALQMPPIASARVDAPDVAVVHAWIQAMASLQDGGEPDAGAGVFDAGDGGHHHDGGDHDGAPGDGGAPDGTAAADAGD